jgi:hypothetical protein
MGRADSRLHGPGFMGVPRLERDATPATNFGLSRDVIGLPTDCLFDHSPGNLLTDLNGEFLDVSKLGPPRDAFLAIDATVQIFGEAIQQVLQLILDDCRVLDARHPWLLPTLAIQDEMAFLPSL